MYVLTEKYACRYQNIPFLWLEKLFCLVGCFCSIMYFHSEAFFNQICSIWLNLSTEYGSVNFRIHSTTYISSHIINKKLMTGSTACAIALAPHGWEIMTDAFLSFPYAYISHPIIQVQVNLIFTFVELCIYIIKTYF